jgi:hypothetical protein
MTRHLRFAKLSVALDPAYFQSATPQSASPGRRMGTPEASQVTFFVSNSAVRSSHASYSFTNGITGWVSTERAWLSASITAGCVRGAPLLRDRRQEDGWGPRATGDPLLVLPFTSTSLFD